MIFWLLSTAAVLLTALATAVFFWDTLPTSLRDQLPQVVAPPGDTERPTASPWASVMALPLLALTLVLGTAAFSFNLFQPAVQTVTLPIEVMGPDGVTETVQLDVDNASSVDHLWVKAYSIGYPYHYANMRGYSVDKASVRLNGGDWVDINNSTVTCEQPEESARCVDGPMHTIRFRLPIDRLGAVQNGANALTFRFNYAHPDGELGDPSTGYRILGLEMRSASGTDQIDGTTFQWDDPGSWTAPSGYGSSSDVSAGEDLWHQRNLLIDGWNGEQIWASCADCHVKNGYDLEYFAFSNKSIVERSRFHGLSVDQGKKIAAYIRSLELTAEDGSTIDPPGRPWNPPYQPGPTAAGSRTEAEARTQGQSFSELDPIYWAAGAGAEWALDNDAQMKQFLFPNGVTYDGDVQVDQSLNVRELPTAAQMPDWNEWLPVHHPVDVWGQEFESSAVWNAYQNEVPSLIQEAKNGNIQKAAEATKLFHFHLQSSSEKFRDVPIPDPYEFEAAELSRMQWGAVKTFETLHTNHLEDRAQDIYGNAAEPLQWPSRSRILFDQAPHIQGWVKGDGGGIMDRYHDAAWYHLQMVVNSGAGIATGNAPMDWKYHYAHVSAANDVGGPHSWRLVASYLRLLQNANGLGADYSGTEPEGWYMRHTTPVVMERNLGHWAEPSLGGLSSDEYRQAVNVSMKALMDGLDDTSFSEWSRAGLDAPKHERQFGIEPESHQPMHVQNYGSGADPLDRRPWRYDDVTYADHFWTSIEYFGQAGAAYSVLDQMANWAETAWPNGDWSGRISQFQDNPPLDEPSATVSLTEPSDGATFADPSSIGLQATASIPDGSVEEVEFFVDGTPLATDTDPAYTATWGDVTAGTHTVSASVTGTGGATATDEITITVESDDGGGGGGGTPPADDPDNPDGNGVAWSYYEGSWDALPDFGSLSPVSQSTSSGFSLAPAQRDDNFGMRFTGYLDVPADGEYTFYLTSDDGSQLSIDGALIVDNDGTHASQEASGTASLSAGPHPITVDFFEATGAEVLTVEWESDQFGRQSIPAERLFVNEPDGGSAPTVAFETPSDGATFSAPSSISLEASASAPDGSVEQVEFLVDGEVIGTDDSPAYTAEWSRIGSGTHTLVARATSASGATASDEITVTIEGTSSSGIQWTYYEGEWDALPSFESLRPIQQGTSASFTLTPAQRDDNFAMRFTGYLDVPADGEYTFYTSSDDGSQLHIDGSLVVDNDGLHASEEASGTISLSAGSHAITVDYFEATGAQQLAVQWASDQFGKEPIPAERLSTAPPTTNPPSVAFLQPTDGATVSTPTTLEADASASSGIASVTFRVDGSTVGTDDEPPYTASWSGATDGTHTLTAEAASTTGTTATTTIDVSVSDGGGAGPAPSGVAWAYYEGQWGELPDFGSLSPIAQDTSASFTLAPAQRGDNFGMRFTGYLDVPSDGEYTFYLTSDDGSRLSIDGSPVVDNDGRHGAREKSGTITLTAGRHPITVDYFEGGGGEQLSVQWASGQFGKQSIPSERLYAAPGTDDAPTGPPAEYTLTLESGWNLVSAPVAPNNPSMPSVFEEVRDVLVVAKNEVGDIYSPSHNVSTLGQWRATEAYEVYLTEERSITLTGPRVATETPIQLIPGWNYVPYLPSEPLPVETALESLGDGLVIVKDEAGNAYINGAGLSINEIGQLQPGEGYKVYVETAQTLTYPPSGTTAPIATAQAQTASSGAGVSNDATIVVQAAALEDGAVVHAQVDGKTISQSRVSEGTAALTVPGTDTYVARPGAQAEPDELITFVTGPVQNQRSLDVQEVTNLLSGQSASTPVRFAPNSVFVVGADATPDAFELQKNHPNPAQGPTRITYSLPERAKVRLDIYNVLGQRVQTVVNAPRPAGTHEVTIKTGSLSSGVYFYRLEAGDHRETRKMTVVK